MFTLGGSRLFISELGIGYDARIRAELWNLQAQDP